MKPEELNAIKERALKATAGPWTATPGDSYNAYPVVCCKASGKDLIVFDIADDAPTEFPGCNEDAQFIAHARTDVPALLDEIGRLNAELATIKRILNDPIAVHANLLRGTIACPSADTLRHLIGAEDSAQNNS